MTSSKALADQLLNAQVAYLLEMATPERLHLAVADTTRSLFDLLGSVRLDAVVTEEEVTTAALALLERVPPSTTASTLLAAYAAVVHQGSDTPFSLAQVITREQAEALLAELLALTPVLEEALEQITDSPMVGTVATRFLSRVVTDVINANRSVAEKIPGVGSIMSLGAGAASKVMSAAEVPMQLVGDTAGKGATFAVRRLNAILIDTLDDPALLQAIMEVWDQQSGTPLTGVAGSPAAAVLTEADVQRIAGLGQDVVITAASSEPVREMATRFIGAFFEIYGEYPLTTLLRELEVSDADVLAVADRMIPRLVEAARADGSLEAAIRGRLEPFFASVEVAEMLRGLED